MARLLTLAPRPRGPNDLDEEGTLSKGSKSQSLLTHSETEWAAMYPEIERLYVVERRKLRYIMQLMETRHGFKATTQMYKKRLAKWGFQKYNTKRSSAATATAAAAQVEHGSRALNGNKAELIKPGYYDYTTRGGDVHYQQHTSYNASTGVVAPMLFLLPTPHENDELNLRFLTTVRNWSVAFFEQQQQCQQQSPKPLLLPTTTSTVEANEINFAFKLVIDLLDRGHGKLAGRMARKAFLLVEHLLLSPSLLQAAGPAVLWNLLELMHDMVALPGSGGGSHHGGGAQLFGMLLRHLDNLLTTNTRHIPDMMSPESNMFSGSNHPLPAMLRLLRQLFVAHTAATTTTTTTTTAAAAAAAAATTDSSSCSSPSPWVLLPLASLLEQAWVMNAQMLLSDRFFDPDLIPLYWCISWDSSSSSTLKLPPGVIDAALDRIEKQEQEEEEQEEEEGMLHHGLGRRYGACKRMKKEIISPATREYLLAVDGDGKQKGGVFPTRTTSTATSDTDLDNTSSSWNILSVECLMSSGGNGGGNQQPSLEIVEMLHASSMAALRKAARRNQSTATTSSSDTTTLLGVLAGMAITSAKRRRRMSNRAFLDNDDDEEEEEEEEEETTTPGSSSSSNSRGISSSRSGCISGASSTSPGCTTPKEEEMEELGMGTAGVTITLEGGGGGGGAAGATSNGVPRMHSVTAACTIRVLMDPDLSLDTFLELVAASSDTTTPPAAAATASAGRRMESVVERIRIAVALREYARGEADPQVVREMWLLEEALAAAGEHDEAGRVRSEALGRLERYVEDIPVGSV